MNTHDGQAQAAIIERNAPWVVESSERMMNSLDVGGIVGDPSETTMAIMASSAAVTLAFSLLRGQFGPDAVVKQMLADMIGEMNFDEHEAGRTA